VPGTQSKRNSVTPYHTLERVDVEPQTSPDGSATNNPFSEQLTLGSKE